MKKLTIELLNLVMEHCNQSESESAFKALQDIDVLEFKERHYKNCILSCLDDLKKEIENNQNQ